MKIHKVTLVTLDLDDIGEEEIKIVLENTRYPNRCISPEVLKIETKEIGEWHDDHPLNNQEKFLDEVEKLFGEK